MKKLLLLALSFLFICIEADAQGVKKYVTLEHFTNTRCSICSSRNPAMFNTIANYPDDLHHIAYHPSVPYSTCEFYQHNTSGNNARAIYYDILGTPRIAVNGTMQMVSGTLLPEANLTAEFNQLSPIEVVVSEEGDDTRTVTVEVKTHGDAPTGNLKLLVAVAEKIVNYDAPNGETVHHNVFRAFLSENDGDVYTPAITGESITFNYTYSINSEWEAEEAYVLAYVQDLDTGEIFNSGTKFDEAITTSNTELSKVEQFSIFPNPTNKTATINFTTITTSISSVSILNTAGQVVATQNIPTGTASYNMNLENFTKGLYFIKVEDENQVAIERLVKN